MRWQKYHRKAGYSYTLGVFPTLELLAHQSGRVLEILLHSSGEQNSGVTKIRALCQRAGIPVTVSDKGVGRLAQKENVYAIGLFEKYACSLLPNANHVVLFQPSDAGNMGTALRTLLGFGFSDLAIIRPGVDLFDPRTIRASMGALFRVNFAYFDTFDGYHQAFSRHLYPFMTDGGEAINRVRFEPPFSLVFGSESKGLPPEFHQIGTSVRIPHQDTIDSLNLSVAIGIGLYEAAKKIG